MQSLEMLGEIGYYAAFNKCVYAQNQVQSKVTAQDPNGLLLCIKDFKNTYEAKEK
jgi:recombinational DNA repair protein (RecF pathway)